MNDAMLHQAHGDGQRAWPGVALPFERFAAQLSKLDGLPPDLRPRARELFLAVACAAGDPVAQSYFDTLYLKTVPRHVVRLGLDRTQLDDLIQTLRIKLLTGPNPRIASYAGRAPLQAWLRVAALRAALDLIGEEKSWAADSRHPTMAALFMTEADPEILASKKDLRESFQAALEQSLASLESREQLLLRMQVVEGLGLDALARVFLVHRATVARWLVAARGKVFDGVRARLGLRRQPTSSEFRSLVRLVKDDLAISIERVLPPPQASSNERGR